jgi:hypothetical protein
MTFQSCCISWTTTELSCIQQAAPPQPRLLMADAFCTLGNCQDVTVHAVLVRSAEQLE